MSGQDLADFIGARQIRPDLWVRDCPVHPDEGKSLMVLDQGPSATLRCKAGCGTIRILAALNLKWKDYSSKPRVPDTSNMTEDERLDYSADRNTRQIEHGEVCILLRKHWRLIDQLRNEIGFVSVKDMTVPQRARWRLAQRELKELKTQERKLRA